MIRVYCSKTVWFDLLWLTVVIGILNYCFLGSVPLFTPDEGRYAEIAREMLVTHQFLIPHLDGVIYFEKPPLSYWINAGIMQYLGYSEWVVRTSVAVFGLLGCLATYFTAQALFNRRVGIVSALILSTCLLYFAMSHMSTTDMPLTFFLISSLYSFLLAVQLSKGWRRSGWLWAGYLLAGLAVMTKGLIGIAFPAIIALIWLVCTRQWRLLKDVRLFSGLLIILCINLPWLLLVQKQVPAFLSFYFIDQQFARYATPIAGRHMSIINYCIIFVASLYPWIIWLPQAIKQHFPTRWSTCFTHRNELYLLIWAVFIFVFFACSHSILIPYLLPILPPLAILMAKYLDHHWNIPLSRSQRISALCFAVINLILCVGLFFLPHCFVLTNTTHHVYYLLVIPAFFLLLGGIIAWIAAYRASLKYCFILLLSSTYLFLIATWGIAFMFNVNSVKPLALDIKTLLINHPDAIVVNDGTYHQDLPYYAQHTITIADWKDELTFGFQHQPSAQAWLIDQAAFVQQWRSNQRLYVTMNRQTYQTFCPTAHPTCYVLNQTPFTLLITNQDPTL